MLEKFWKDEYDHRDLVDCESSKNDFKRAIEVAGPLSLYSASRDELQKEIAKHAKGNKQRRVVSRLNTLLKYIQRNNLEGLNSFFKVRTIFLRVWSFLLKTSHSFSKSIMPQCCQV